MRDTWKVKARGPRMLPAILRLLLRLVVLVLGITLIVISVALGWLPGPGGIPLFLAGVALLSTQFEWAKRLRGWIFAHLRRVSDRARRRRGAPDGPVPPDAAGELGDHVPEGDQAPAP